MKFVEFTCTNCGSEQRKPRRTTTEHYFCSTVCATEWRRAHPVQRYVCCWCGCRFGHDRREETKHFCSRKCWLEYKADKSKREAEESLKLILSQSLHIKAVSKIAPTPTGGTTNNQRKSERQKRWVRRHKEAQRLREDIRRARVTGAGGCFTNEQWEAMKRHYDYRCLCCGRKEPETKLTPDHVIPLALGGGLGIDNIQPLCRSCNSKKRRNTTDYRPKEERVNG